MIESNSSLPLALFAPKLLLAACTHTLSSTLLLVIESNSSPPALFRNSATRGQCATHTLPSNGSLQPSQKNSLASQVLPFMGYTGIEPVFLRPVMAVLIPNKADTPSKRQITFFLSVHRSINLSAVSDWRRRLC